MALPLERTLKREVVIDGAPYTVTLSPLGVKLVRKGFRKGRAVSWRALLAQGVPDGDAGDGEGPDGEDGG
jgi:ribosomal protein S5